MMTGHSNEYGKAASKYRPNAIDVLFIAASPPACTDESKKLYLFFERNPVPNSLFSMVYWSTGSRFLSRAFQPLPSEDVMMSSNATLEPNSREPIYAFSALKRLVATELAN